MDLAAEMIEKRELARLIWRFKQDPVETECLCETISKGASQMSFIVKQTHTCSAFTSFHHKLQRAGIQPSMALPDPLLEGLFRERAVMLFTELELNVEPAAGGHTDDLSRIQIGICKPLSAFDSCDANVRTEIEICGKLPFAYGDFKWTSSRDSGNAKLLCSVNLATRARFVGHNPA